MRSAKNPDLCASVESGATSQADWFSLAPLPAQAWRGRCVSAKGAHALRPIARPAWCLRDPASGSVLALRVADRWQPVSAPARAQLKALTRKPAAEAADQLRRGLGIRRGHPALAALPRVSEAQRLVSAGRDRYGRPLLLDARAARAFQRMRAAARLDGVVLEVVSGFRGLHHQAGIFRRKLARGQLLEDILRINAPPGYSEHHSGRALDLSCPGEPAAEESFENTRAFAWLAANAWRFGFRMSYPRGNPHGIAYEPWHWCWHPSLRLR